MRRGAWDEPLPFAVGLLVALGQAEADAFEQRRRPEPDADVRPPEPDPERRDG